MAHVIHVLAVLFLLGTCATYYVAEGAPTNDTLFLIAEVEGGNLDLIEWDLKAAKSNVSVLSPVPGSYSTTSTFAAFDPQESKLYWSTGPGKLFTRYIGDSPMQNNMSLLESTDSLPFAVDDVTRLIYYAKSTDSGSIYAMTMDGKYATALVSVPDQSIRELEADPEDGYLYWLSEVKNAAVKRYIIYRCDIAGGNAEEIFAPAAGAVESFTLDRAGNALYCVHGATILKLSYSGSVISNMTFDGLIKITYAADGILYGITRSRSVIKVDFNAETSKYVAPPVGALRFRLSNKGIAFYSPKTPPGSNKCSSSVHPCSHFCLPAPGQTFKCACPVDHVLLKDNKTCEKTISCDPIALNHSKVNCYRSPDDKQFCKFQCDSGYVYHPRYNLTELFECKARVWHPEPDMQKCLEIEKPAGVRIHGNVAFNASYPCHLVKPTNEKAVKSETIRLLTGANRPLEPTCLTYTCREWSFLSCDEGKNLLKVKFYIDIGTTLDAAERQTLKNNITASFAAAMLQPSRYKMDVSGDTYPMAYLTFVKLGHACHALYEESNTGCVACPAGTHFNAVSEMCELCPKARYSSRPRSFQCTQCGPHQTTLREGAASSSECKDFCNEGLFYDDPTKSCKECEVGYYQDTVGIAPCKHCGDGKTTHGKGSKLPSDCLDLCPAGHYHNNETKSCQPCEKDTFQNRTWSYSCQRCPNGMVTPTKGAKSTADCILSCQVGKFFEVKKGYCERCPANHYQDSEGSTSCVPCDSGLISNVGSDSKSDCERQDQTILIAGSVGGVVLFMVVLVVSIVLCKKRCKRLLPERPETGFENPAPVENGRFGSHNFFNSNGGMPYPQFGEDFDPYERTLSPSPPDPYTLLGPVQMRSRHERYEGGQGPFNREPGPPSLPAGGRYMSPEEWTKSRLQQLEEAARNSGVYDDLKEEDPYDRLPDCAKGPTGPEDTYLEANAAGVHGGAHLNEDDDGYDRLKDCAKGPTGPEDAYLEANAAGVRGGDASAWRVAGAPGGADLEPAPPVMLGDIQLDTLESRY